MPAKPWPSREEAEKNAKPQSQKIYWMENGKQKSAPNPLHNPSLSRSKNPVQNSNISSSETTPVSIVVDRLEADAPEQKPLRGEKQYRDFLLQSLGVTSLLLALLVCWIASLPTFLAEELAFTPEEVEAFATPGARLLAKSKIPENVKHGMINSGDYIGLGTAALMYVYRVLDTMKTFKEHTVNGSSRPTQSVPTPVNNSNGAGYPATVNGTAASLSGWGNFTAG